MDRGELTVVLKDLDRTLSAPCDIILVGGAAMVLHFGARRATSDIVPLRCDSAELRRAISAVARERGLPENWMNDAAKGFADILPPDFSQRLMPLDLPLRHLRLWILGRPEQVAMKVVALREHDLEDLELLLPPMSEVEKRVLLGIIDHVGTFRPDWALKIRYFLLEQGWQIS